MKDIVTQLRTNSECLAPSIMLEAADTIERLRAERDEARREVCRSRASCIKDKQPEEIANALGWGCFKQEEGK